MESLESLTQQALARPADQRALEFEGRWICWGDIRKFAETLNGLMEEIKVPPGARVALVARNRPTAIAVFLALLARRYSVHMVYPFQSTARLARQVEEVAPDVLIAEPDDYEDVVVKALEGLGAGGIAVADMHGKAIRPVERVTGSRAPAEDPAIVILTSGTTGYPKPFRLSYELVARHIVGPLLALNQANPNTTPALLYFPIGNISGLYTTLPPLLSGQGAVLLDRFSLDGWRDYIRRFKPAIGGLPPAGFQMVLDADIPREELTCLRVMAAGAAPLSPDVQRAFEERYGIPILLSYGATEFAGPVTAMTSEMYGEWGGHKRGSVGRALPGVQLRVIDPDTGDVLPAGDEGILEVVSPRIGPAWMRTSDIAVIDEDGFLFLRGRADGAIMRGGFKLLPETIERALLLHPAVAAAAVVGLSDKRLGQVPVAAVQLKPGVGRVTEKNLEAHLREQVLATHIPVHWRFVEELPRTKLSFKVDLPAVRELFS